MMRTAPGRTQKQTPREAIVYIRVSTDEQARSGLGLEAQEARCRAWATAHGLEVVAVFVDEGASAKSLRRPALERALATLKPGRVLVAYRLDRLTRTQSDFPVLAAHVETAGAQWATVEEKFDTSTAVGRAMLSIILTFSQLERVQTSERTVAALTAKRQRRERLGATPLGYRTLLDGSIEVDAEEMATVQRARELRAAGQTLRQIGEMLTGEGRRSKRGGRWGVSSVRLPLTPHYVEQVAA